MDKILFINACIRPNSRTLELANYVLSKLNGKVEEVNLYNEELLPLNLKELELRDSANKSNDFSNNAFRLARQFANAKTIVIASPYWDLSFPSVVKTYFEKVTVNGLTFKYGENGIPTGLCNGQNLIYITTSGGPITFNFGYDYVSTLAKGFYGIKNVQLVKAEGLDVYGADVNKIIATAKDSFKGLE